MKIAIYTCNVGDYRDEFKNYYNVCFDSNIDYFLYTDKYLNEHELSQLGNWKVQHVIIEKSEGTMDDYRWTAKTIKFKLPELLQSYDVIVWADSKMFKYTGIQNITYDNIKKLLDCNNCDVINYAHPRNANMCQELILTRKIGCENYNSVAPYYNFIRKHVSKFTLPDTAFIIRKNTPHVNEAFEYVLDLLKFYKLQRDQNVYNLAFDTKGVLPVVMPALDGQCNII